MIDPALEHLARQVTGRILRNLMGRKGFDCWWEEIDPETQRKIEDQIAATVAEALSHTGHTD